MNKTKSKISIFALLMLALMLASVSMTSACVVVNNTPSVWYNGQGVPASSLGDSNDYYLNTATYDIFFKGSGSWLVIGNILGATGATGSQGIAGTNGVNGLNGLNGIDGINGQDGAVGATGAQGVQGVQGATGLTGATGMTGATGAQGIAGTNGTNGINGTNGTNGINGKDGYSIISGVGNPNFNGAVGNTNTLYVDAETGQTWVYVVEVTSPTSYTSGWYLQGTIKGDTGAQGEQGVAGANGSSTKGLDGSNVDPLTVVVLMIVGILIAVGISVVIHKKIK